MLETYIILITNVALINSMKIKKKKRQKLWSLQGMNWGLLWKLPTQGTLVPARSCTGRYCSQGASSECTEFLGKGANSGGDWEMAWKQMCPTDISIYLLLYHLETEVSLSNVQEWTKVGLQLFVWAIITIINNNARINCFVYSQCKTAFAHPCICFQQTGFKKIPYFLKFF